MYISPKYSLLWAALVLVIFLSAMLTCVHAQTQPVLSANGLDFPLQNPPGTVAAASISRLGNPGQSIVYYWIVANSLVGQGALAGPFALPNAPAGFTTSYALASGTYTSGITATGTAGQTCSLSAFNHGSTATATVALTGINTIAGGTALNFQNYGNSATSAPTSATAGNGSATCAGTAVVATVLGHNYSTGAVLNWQPVNGALSYDCLKTATAIPPAGTANYAVDTGLTAGTCSDTGQSLAIYTVAPIDVRALAIRMQNQATGNNASCIALNGVCITGTETLYYQTVDAATVAQTQEPALDFAADFAISDSAGVSTDVALSTQTGLTPGTYSSTAVNAKGIVTAASNPAGCTAANCLARAWVEFSGGDPAVILASNGVASVVRNSLGVYTVTLTNAMPSVNYLILISSGPHGTIGGTMFYPVLYTTDWGGSDPTTTSFQVAGIGGTFAGLADLPRIDVAVFSTNSVTSFRSQ